MKNGRFLLKKLSFYLLLCLFSISFSNICTASNHTYEYDYVPRDKVGEFSFFVDGLRLLQVSYKDIPLIAQWGEFYALTKDPIYKSLYDYPKKIPVKVRREKGLVEYLWWSGNYEKGYRQVNRVLATPKHIVSEITLEIKRNAPKEIIFHPVLFPGYTTGYLKGAKETRIEGKECEVLTADGQHIKTVYPFRAETFDWLPQNTRGVTFFLKEGKISFLFSSTDPTMKLSFKGNDVFLTDRSRPVIGGTLVLNPTGESYQTTLRMEISVDNPPTELLSHLEAVPFPDDIVIEVNSSKTGNLFLQGEPVKFTVTADNSWNNSVRNIELNFNIVDYDNRSVYSTRRNIQVGANAKMEFSLVPPLKERGIYSLEIKATESGKLVGFTTSRFGIVAKPSEYPSEKSYFGTAFGAFYEGAWDPATKRPDFLSFLNEVCRLMYNLGIKNVRYHDHLLRWSYIEKEQGKFVFNPASDMIIDTILKNGFHIWLGGFVVEDRYPEWALSDMSYAPHGNPAFGVQKIPKDFALYENYIYRLVDHLRGRINYFELDNEPQGSDINVKAQFYQAGYRGAKRANPESVILGASIADLSSHSLDWLESFLAETEGKTMDIISFHYPHGFTRAEIPESPNYETNFQRLISLARKYNLRLWDGEDGQASNYLNAFPHMSFQTYEKDFVNRNLRSCLLTLSHPEVERIVLCYAAQPFGLAWEPMNQYSVGWIGATFWQLGGSVSPWGVAFSNLSLLFDGAKFQERINMGMADVYCLLFNDRDGLPLFAIWSPFSKVNIKIPVSPSMVEVITVMGATKVLSGATTVITVGQEPVYIKGRNIKNKGEIISAFKKAEIETFLDTEMIKEKLETTLYGAPDGQGILLSVRNKFPVSIKLDTISFTMGDKRRQEMKDIQIPGHGILHLNPGFKIECLTDARGTLSMRIGKVTITREISLHIPSVKEILQKGNLVVRRRQKEITFQGNEEEYRNAIPIELRGKEQVYLAKEDSVWKGPDDLSVTAWLLYDENYFYFAARVRDDFFRNINTGRNCWNGDSIQIGIDSLNDSSQYVLNIGTSGYNDNDFEISVALTEDGPVHWRRSFGNLMVSPDGPIPGAKLNVTRISNNTLFYELAIPFKELYPLFPAVGRETRFNFIVNDDDGQGRNKWMGITGGIGEKKDPSIFKKMVFLP